MRLHVIRKVVYERSACQRVGKSELTIDEVASLSSILTNRQLVMLMVARSRATTCTADRSRRRGGGCPTVRGTFREEGSMNTHTKDEVQEGSLPPQEAQWERQAGASADAVAKLGQGQRRSPGREPARGGTTPPVQQGAPLGGFAKPSSISPPQPAEKPSATSKSKPPPRAAPALGDDDNNHHREVARAPVVLSSGRVGEIGTAASCTSPALGLEAPYDPDTFACHLLAAPRKEETSPLLPRQHPAKQRGSHLLHGLVSRDTRFTCHCCDG